MLNNNLTAMILTLVAALIWLRLIEYAVQKAWLTSTISRKLIHIGTGPLFVLCWLLFPNTPSSRYYAAVIPLLITLHFFLVGIGVEKDQNAVRAMSRTGTRQEILFGPLFYGIIFVTITILFWYDIPTGIIALMILSGGDGLADVFGRRFGETALPWSQQKTWMGMVGMFLGAWVLSIGMMAIYTALHIFNVPLNTLVLPITLITLLATLVESLPINNLDNITVTISAVLVGSLLL